jgi:hypothetical protein
MKHSLSSGAGDLAAAAFVAAFAFCGASACAHAPRSVPVTLLDYHATPPAGWSARTPSSSARLSELVLRDAATRDSVELIVYYFGASQGGGIDANVERWTAQFNGPGRAVVKPRIAKIEGTAFPTTEVELEGSYARAIGMGDPSKAIPGQALLASIVETPRGNLYVQMFGPAARVQKQRSAYRAFVKGIR